MNIMIEPSAWVTRFAPLIAAHGAVLDLACGGGRHSRLLARLGYRVCAVDRDAAALASLAAVAGVSTCCADLEQGSWPCADASFDGVVVTNYLYRPRFQRLIDVLRPGGVLIYETFMRGNEAFGKPGNPEFLLNSNELLDRVRPALTVLAFEQGPVESPRPAVIQRICARAAAA